jgi:hypothetical protein
MGRAAHVALLEHKFSVPDPARLRAASMANRVCHTRPLTNSRAPRCPDLRKRPSDPSATRGAQIASTRGGDTPKTGAGLRPRAVEAWLARAPDYDPTPFFVAERFVRSFPDTQPADDGHPETPEGGQGGRQSRSFILGMAVRWG